MQTVPAPSHIVQEQAETPKPGTRPRTRPDASPAPGDMSAVLENYVVAIGQLIDQEGEARPTALARRVGVSHVAAIRGITRLKALGLARSKPYRSVFLTAAGMALVQKIGRRRNIVAATLVALGVPRDIALRDIEGVEYHVSPQALVAFAAFLRRPEAWAAGPLNAGQPTFERLPMSPR